MRLDYAGTADTGCAYEEVPILAGSTCGPVKDWFPLTVVGGPQFVTDDAGHPFTFAAAHYPPRAG